MCFGPLTSFILFLCDSQRLIFHTALLFFKSVPSAVVLTFVSGDQNRELPTLKTTKWWLGKKTEIASVEKTKRERICGRMSRLDSQRGWLWRALKAKRHCFSLLRYIMCKHFAEWVCVCLYFVFVCVPVCKHVKCMTAKNKPIFL